MTRSEAIDMLRQIGTYLTAGNPMWRTEPIREACNMAIEALTEKEPSAKDINVPINDCISRQAAINALYGITAYKNSIPLFSAVFNIEKLPSAERRGKWIKHDNSCECPFCHTYWSYFDNEVEWFKYCPNCGARMEGDNERV